MKRLIVFLLALVFCAAAAVPALAAGGSCGESLTWSYSDGTLTISGTGDMTDYYSYRSEPWAAYSSSITRVDIGEGVTSIGDRAFENCERLTSVTIPKNVTRVGNYSFCWCTSLTEILVDAENENLASLDGVLFNKSMTELIVFPAGKGGAYTVPEGVITIGENAFYFCKRLTAITFPHTLVSIQSDAFELCTGLGSLELPGGLRDIQRYAFSSCSGVASVTLGGDLNTIGTGAFEECSGLKNVYFRGSEADWRGINLGSDNWRLENASIHYIGKPASASAPEDGRGDIDGDGIVDDYDAALILRAAVGLIDQPDPAVADADGDGAVDDYDAALILRFAVGLISALPA